MRNYLPSLLFCVLCLPIVAMAGGGGDGDGADIFPEHGYTYYHIDDRGEVEVIWDVSDFARMLFDGDGLGDGKITGAGGKIDLDVSFNPPIEDPDTGALITPVHISGVAFGKAISVAGFGIPDGNGKLCLIDSQSRENGSYCVFMIRRETGPPWAMHGHWRIDPAELGDGDPGDDCAGSATLYQGCPIGRFPCKY